jgi:hypothetical protein
VGLAILDGPHALYKVGKRREARGRVRLRQPGRTRAARNADRWGHLRDALFAAHLHQGVSAVALNALEVDASPSPWLPQATTTILLYGAYEDEPQRPAAPHPACGHSTEGRDARTQGLRRLGVRGAGGRPRRVGLRDGTRSDSVATPRAIEAWLALGVAGGRGLVAARQASSRRPLGCWLAPGMGCVT